MCFLICILYFFFLYFPDKPICIEDQTIYGVSEGETAHIACRVDSYPEADTFAWSFNTSSGGMDLSRDSFTNKGSSSLLYYTPKSQMDYGTVLCVASNVVGRQVVPCIYHVIPAGKIQFVFEVLVDFSSPTTYEKPQNANLLVERHRFWLNCSFVASREQQWL